MNSEQIAWFSDRFSKSVLFFSELRNLNLSANDWTAPRFLLGLRSRAASFSSHGALPFANLAEARENPAKLPMSALEMRTDGRPDEPSLPDAMGGGVRTCVLEL